MKGVLRSLAILLLLYKVLTQKSHEMHPVCDIILVSTVITDLMAGFSALMGADTTPGAPQNREAAITRM